MLMSSLSGTHPLSMIFVATKFDVKALPAPEKSRPEWSVCNSNALLLLLSNQIAHLKPPALRELGDAAIVMQTSPVIVGKDSKASLTSKTCLARKSNNLLQTTWSKMVADMRDVSFVMWIFLREGIKRIYANERVFSCIIFEETMFTTFCSRL